MLESRVANLYMETVAKGKLRIIDNQCVKALIKNIESEDTEMSQIMRALSALHAFNSCDKVSVFSG